MTWPWKQLLGLGLLVLILNGTLLLVSHKIFLGSFIRLENHLAKETLQRGASVYLDELAFLERMTKDWANWDDAYHFMRTRDPGFPASNIVDSTFSTLNVNVIVFLDKNGMFVAGKAFDLAGQEEVPVYRGLLQILLADKALDRLKIMSQGVKGLLTLPEGVLMLASQPVLTGERKGPSQGALLMGRFLDESELHKLSLKANLPMAFSRLNSGREWPAWSAGTAGEPEILLRTVNKSQLRSRILLRDIYGAPAVVIAVSLSRDIYNQGRHAMFYLHLWMLLASAMGGGCVFVIWGRLRGSRQKQRNSEHLFQHLFQFSADAFFLCDEEGRFVDVNHQACRGLGFSRQELLSLCWNDITAAAVGQLLNRTQHLSNAPQSPMEALFTGNHGHTFPGDISVSRFDLQGQGIFFVMVRDITERKTVDDMLRDQRERLNYLAYHDVLTSLPNRLKAIELLQTFIARAKHRGTMVAVLMFDLDRFKNINESLGHETGDEILMEVASRIKGLVRDTDVVARFGGDEFLVLLEQAEDREGIRTVAEKILAAIARPLHIGQQQFYLTGSIGISLFPKHGKDAQAVLKAADSAMYFAKEQGRNTCRFFIPMLKVDVESRLYLETDLRQALEQQQFVLFYQPEFNLNTGKVECLEALLRWQHPQRGVVGPADFIPLAEDTGLIVPIGEWALQEACNQVMAWRSQGLPTVKVAVNISARQFRQSGFIEMVFRIIKQSGLPVELLELEITESMVIQSAEHARNMLEMLRKSGICLAVDDFGLGYSSLSYLKHYPFSKLKMDREFVKNIVKNANEAAIAAAIIAMGTALGLDVVAEGIEGREQLDALRKLACPSGQGFFLALPKNAEETGHFLTRTLGENCTVVKAFRV